MKLTDETIERIAIDYYEKNTRNPAVPEDLCADIYLRFKRSLQKHRGKPGKKDADVNDSFLRYCNAVTIRSVMRIQSRKAGKEAAAGEAYGRTDEDGARLHFVDEESEALSRILSFMKKTAAKASYRNYAHLFILYHAVILPDTFLKDAAVILNIPAPWIFCGVRVLRETIRLRTEESRAVLEARASACYTKMIRLRTAVRDGSFEGTREEASAQYARLKRIQMKAMTALDKLTIYPQYKEIAEAADTHEDTVRYGLRVFRESLAEYLSGETQRVAVSKRKTGIAIA